LSELLLDRDHVELVVDVAGLELLDVEVFDANNAPGLTVHHHDFACSFQRLEINPVRDCAVRKVDRVAVSEAGDHVDHGRGLQRSRHPLNESFPHPPLVLAEQDAAELGEPHRVHRRAR
jgi:hypothetical protein